ncbi:hypothetical protein ACGF0J_21635 [Nonomuraea sp. NPDC047897]|uniref:hypothetical protein n=1 Tax=Nonomuraea sp. NPDC047897 TaxID=3364346 RepID=UPI00371E4126
MIARLPRIIYKRLPDGQDWTVLKVDGEAVIVVNEALGDSERRAARKAARASIHRDSSTAWIPLPLVVGADWLARKSSTPLGAAVSASVITGAAVYGITTSSSQPTHIAEPPAVVTVQATPTGTPTTTPPASATPTRRSKSARPNLPASTAPPLRTDFTLPPQEPTPDRTARPARTTRPPAPPTEATSPPATEPSARPEPPTTQATPSLPATAQARSSVQSPPSAEAEPPAADAPTTAMAGQAGCSGIRLRVDLDPLADLDTCLLG